MMEFHMQAPLGNGKVKVAFTEGSVSSRGVNPATHTTDNFLVQKAIENSPEFKRGLIKKIKVYDLDEEIHVLRNPVKPIAETPVEIVSPQKPETFKAQEPEVPVKVNVTTISDAPIEGSNKEEITGDNVVDETPTLPAEGTPVEVEFSLLDDAKDYLETHYGAVRSKIKTRADAIAFGTAHGVDIKFV